MLSELALPLRIPDSQSYIHSLCFQTMVFISVINFHLPFLVRLTKKKKKRYHFSTVMTTQLYIYLEPKQMSSNSCVRQMKRGMLRNDIEQEKNSYKFFGLNF